MDEAANLSTLGKTNRRALHLTTAVLLEKPAGVEDSSGVGLIDMKLVFGTSNVKRIL
jgi:hypothetical protein